MSTPPVERRIRPCRAEDLEAVAGLYRQWETEAVTWGLIAATTEDLRAKLGLFFLVAERGDEIVGFVAGRRCRASAVPPDNLAVFPGGADYLEVEDLYVVDHARRAGIGTRLVEHLLEVARSQGIAHSTVFSATKDTAQVSRFYERFGYHPWGVQFFR